jgi:hypothetical protein
MTASVAAVESAGIKKLKIYHTANTNDISQPEVLERAQADREGRSGQASKRASKGTS